MRFSHAIYPRIFIPLMIALVIGTFTAWKSATDLFEHHLIEFREQQLGNTVRVLAEGNLPLTGDMLDRLGSLLGSRLIAIADDGTPAGTGDAGLSTEIRDALRNLTLSAGGADRSKVVYSQRAAFSVIVQPLAESSDPRIADLAAIATLRDIRATSHDIALRLGLGAALGLMLLAWVAHRVARGITQPIDRLVDTAHAISTGDLSARAEIKRPKELSTLSDAFADMAQRLGGYQRRSARENRLQALGELAARVAHELRNPLTAIKLQLQLLGEQLQAPAEQARIAKVLEEMRRLELIVSGTLMWGKETQVRPRPGDLDAVARDVIDLMQPQLGHRQIDLSYRSGEPPPVSIDPDRIKQVLFNLINNAADELMSGGRIAVSSAHLATSDSVTLTVEDSGPGLSEEAAERLFDDPQSQKALGLGMGLSISREILAQHGGSIEISDSPELGGARFALHLPIAATVSE